MSARAKWKLTCVAAVLIVCLSTGTAEAARRRQLWVTNAFGNDVHVFDVDTLKLVKRIEVGTNPHGISATADGKTVHVALENFQQPEGELAWIDGRTFEVTHRLKIGLMPNECESTHDGHWIYVPCADENYWVIDGEKKEVAAKIHTGGRPHNTVASPDGKRMYLVPMGAPKRVTIVDVEAGHKVIGEIPFGNVTRPPAISADEKLFFQHIDDLLGFQVADIGRREVIATVQHKIPDDKRNTPSRCHGLGIRPDQQEIWSCNVEHHLVHVHEATSGSYSEVAAIPMIGRIYWLSFTPDSRYCFVSVRSENKIAVVDCQSKQVLAHLEAGKEPKRTQVIDVEE